MRKVIVSNIISIDGYVADVTGDPVALNMDQAFDAGNLDRLRSAGTVLLGRRSYEMFAGYWPYIADAPDDPGNPELDPVNREISRLWSRLPQVVVSDGFTPTGPWTSRTSVVPRAGVVDWLTAERGRGAGDIVVFGSPTTWNGLLDAGQVDELHLMISPTPLGDGLPAFRGTPALRVLEARALEGSRNALVRYAV